MFNHQKTLLASVSVFPLFAEALWVTREVANVYYGVNLSSVFWSAQGRFLKTPEGTLQTSCVTFFARSRIPKVYRTYNSYAGFVVSTA